MATTANFPVGPTLTESGCPPVLIVRTTARVARSTTRRRPAWGPKVPSPSVTVSSTATSARLPAMATDVGAPPVTSVPAAVGAAGSEMSTKPMRPASASEYSRVRPPSAAATISAILLPGLVVTSKVATRLNLDGAAWADALALTRSEQATEQAADAAMARVRRDTQAVLSGRESRKLPGGPDRGMASG